MMSLWLMYTMYRPSTKSIGSGAATLRRVVLLVAPPVGKGIEAQSDTKGDGAMSEATLPMSMNAAIETVTVWVSAETTGAPSQRVSPSHVTVNTSPARND